MKWYFLSDFQTLCCWSTTSGGEAFIWTEEDGAKAETFGNGTERTEKYCPHCNRRHFLRHFVCLIFFALLRNGVHFRYIHFRAKNQQINFNAIFQIQKYLGVKIQIFEQYFLAGKFEILQKLLLAKKTVLLFPMCKWYKENRSSTTIVSEMVYATNQWNLITGEVRK